MIEISDDVAIERQVEARLARAGLDTPGDIYLAYEPLRARVEQELAHAAAGQIKPYRFLVVLEDVDTMPGETRRWHYRAVTPERGMAGCLHEVAGPSRQSAAVEAVQAHTHQQQCQVWSGKGSDV